jgi:hypothetical protein
MKSRRLAISLIAGLILALALTWVLAYRFNATEAAPLADTRYVTTGGSDAGNDCGTQTMPCRSVQHAVDVANPDDIIKVAAGTYDDLHERAAMIQVVYISKTVTIRGGYTTAFTEPPDPVANPTVLDAQGEGRVLVIAPPVEATPTPAAQSPEGPFSLPRRVDATAQAIAPVVEGFHITGGDATLDPLYAGGGVLVLNAEAELNDNSIYWNTAGTDGRGGGVCVIYVYNPDGQQPIATPESTLRANRIYSNSAGEGSGIALWGTAAMLINNTVVDNSSASYETLGGCGVCVLDSTSRMWHTTIARNTAIEGGTGVCVLSSQLGSYAEMTNTIVADHALAGVFVADQFSSATLNGVLWHGNTTDAIDPYFALLVTNQYTGSPAFAPDGYHLTSGSAAIDQGVATSVNKDIDSQIRPMGNGPDLGADEYPATPPSGDATNSDGLSEGTYHPEDTVYVVGSGFVPSAVVHVYVVSDATWFDGMAIPPDLSGDGMNAVSAGTGGSFGPVAIWSPPLVAGEYDVVFDANRNGIFDLATDAVHDPNHPGFVVQHIQTLVDPQSGGTLTYTDPQGNPTTIQFPPAAVTQPISICFSPLISPTYPLPVTYANHAFQFGACGQQPPLVPVGGVTFPPLVAPYREGDITEPLFPYLPIILRDDRGGSRNVGSSDLSREGSGIKVLAAPDLRALVPAGKQEAQSSTVFDQPVTITIHYSDSDVVGIEDNLILYYWTGSAWADAATTCSPTSTYVRDIDNNVLQVEICHLSQFALGG